jgi:biopolymer transport protein TolQ
MLDFLLAQAATTDAAGALAEANVVDNASHTTGILSHMLQSDPVVKLTLLILIGFSVACWAIIVYKLRQLKSAQKDSQNFWHLFSVSQSLSDMMGNKAARNGPLYEIFATGTQVISKMRKATGRSADLQRQTLVQKLNQAREEEMHKLEQYVPFLATTASAAPFIGLFGTVWGILTAFMAIGKAGSSSLATVGPFISEALVATAVGLFAAIPAVIAYNFFINKIRVIGKLVDLFIDEFVLKSEVEAG